MFNWMNRRLYHAIRIWFRVFGVVSACIGAVVALVFSVYYVGRVYGQTAGLFAFFALLLNSMIAFLSWMHLDLSMLEDRRKIEKYKESKNPPLSWCLFGWMNRRFYHWAKAYLIMLTVVIIGISTVVGVVITADHVGKTYGISAGLAVFFGAIGLFITCAIAWIKSEEAVKEEIREQDRILRSLQRDWIDY